METRELVREVPGEGRRGRSAANVEEDEEDEGTGVGGNGGWKQTLLEICITTPRGSQRRRVAGTRGKGVRQKGGRGWLSVEKAGAHTSIRGTTPRAPRAPSSSLRATATRPPPYARSSNLLSSSSAALLCRAALSFTGNFLRACDAPVPSVYVVVVAGR